MIRIDQKQAIVEGYILIGNVSEEEIIVLYKTYTVTIIGLKLRITYFDKYEMHIQGTMLKVVYDYD